MRCAFMMALGVVLLLAPRAGAEPVLQVYLEDKGGGQKVRLFVPETSKAVRGIIFDLGYGHGADRPDFQAFARANDFAVIGSLLRWPPTLDQELEAIIADLAKRSNHPELVHAPWVMQGFSRSTGPNHQLAVKRPEKVLAVLAGGVSPGVTPEQVPVAKRVPTMCVIGSADPFAAGPEGVKNLDWFFKSYPNYREKEIAWGAAITWGAGHSPETAFVMQSAFLRDVIEQRVPKEWDPTKGPPELRDAGKVEGGYLGDPTTWGTAYPTVAAYAEFKGDRRTAHWLPGAYSAAVWRAYCVKEPRLEVVALPASSLTVVAADKGRVADAEWFAGVTSIGKGDAIGLGALPRFGHVYVVATVDGTKAISRPVLVSDGKIVPTGEDPARPTQAPLALLELGAAEKATLRALIERSVWNGPSEWKPVYADDFSKGIGPWKLGLELGKKPSTAEAADGVLRIASDGQMICALPYDFPRDVAVEYRFRSVGEKPNNVSCMINGHEGGARPWREGALMFHVGTAPGSTIFWQVNGEYDKTTVPAATANAWHTVRVERTGDRLHAEVDGKAVPERKLSSNENSAIKARRIGFYTVGNTAEIDDVKVFARVPKEPAEVTPAAPAPAALEALAAALARLMDAPFAEQRNLSGEVITTHADVLLPALAKVPAEALGPKAKARVEQLMRAKVPE